MFDLAISLDDKSSVPLYEQLSEHLRLAIGEGRLPPGSKMPSTRQIATKFGISRMTVLHCFELLASQGYVQSKSGKGIFVTDFCPNVGPLVNKPDGTLQDAVDGAHLDDVHTDGVHLDRMHSDGAHVDGVHFSTFCKQALAQDEVVFFSGLRTVSLPSKLWRKLLLRQLSLDESPADEEQKDALGYKPLRVELSNYLMRSWSVNCNAEQVVVFTNPFFAVDFISKIFLDPGDRVMVENPGPRRVRDIFKAHGAQLSLIDVDEQGSRVENSMAVGAPIKLAYVNPAHQFPTGVTMSYARRKQLLAWADQTGALILEDNHLCESTPDSLRLASLQALGGGGQVIYLSSFWRVLFPLVKLSFAVFPAQFMPAVKKMMAMLECGPSTLEQSALTEFIRAGYLERQVKRNVREYSQRRQILIAALIKHFQNKIWIRKEGSPLHLLVRFRLPIGDEQIAQKAQNAGFVVFSTQPQYEGEPVSGEFLIPFGLIEKEEIELGVKRLAEALSPL